MKKVVKPAIFLLLLFCSVFSSLFSFAQDKTPAPDQDTAEVSQNEVLPEIEAKVFPVRIVRRSNSNRVYLAEDPKNRQPPVGRMLLLKQDQEPAMALRVLKLYPDKQLVALKRLKKYPGHRILEDGTSYSAIEKLSDINPPPPTQADRDDLNELEDTEGLKPVPFDPDLDTGTTPPPDKETDEYKDLMTIEETKLIDPFSHWLTAGFGYVRNSAPPSTGGSFYFSAGNLRYGLNIGKLMIFKQPRLQDSLTLETGLYFYKTLSFATSGDSYTLLSLLASLRFNLLTSQSFGFFFYGGLMQGFVLSSTLSQAASVAALTTIQIALGTGFLFQLGPHWYTRIDLGLDSIGINLSLRF